MELKLENTIDNIINEYNKTRDDKIINYTDEKFKKIKRIFDCANTIKFRCLLSNSIDELLTTLQNTIDEFNKDSSIQIIDFSAFKPTNKLVLKFMIDGEELILNIKNFIPKKLISNKETNKIENLNIELTNEVLRMIRELKDTLTFEYFKSLNYNLVSIHRKLKTKTYKKYIKAFNEELKELMYNINASLSHSYIRVSIKSSSLPGTWELKTEYID